MKIVYSTNTIYKLGGIEIVTVVKANALAAIPGNQVWIAVADNRAASIISLKNVSVIDLALYLTTIIVAIAIPLSIYGKSADFTVGDWNSCSTKSIQMW